jgi:hypothetical protein
MIQITNKRPRLQHQLTFAPWTVSPFVLAASRPAHAMQFVLTQVRHLTCEFMGAVVVA